MIDYNEVIFSFKFSKNTINLKPQFFLSTFTQITLNHITAYDKRTIQYTHCQRENAHIYNTTLHNTIRNTDMHSADCAHVVTITVTSKDRNYT